MQTLTDAQAETIAARLADGGGVLEWIAREHDVPTFRVLELLPASERLIVRDPPLADLLDQLSAWGEVMIIVQSPSLVAEVVSPLPPATSGRGFLNFHGDTPFGGHLKEDACGYLACVDRTFNGRRSLSVVFYDHHGESIFKVFVRRDDQRELIPAQITQFEQFRERLAAG
ncbi:MAG: heme utilization cystosolic carrier protein HutX [Pseudomonadota bacterium]